MNGQSIAERLKIVNFRMEQACARVGRDPRGVRLLAVSKLQSPEAIHSAFLCGQSDFAENYVQEVVHKQEQLVGDGIHWHFIGRIQSNKLKMLSQGFRILHSVDRASIIDSLDRMVTGPAPQDIFLQFNVAHEASKGGVDETEMENLVRFAVQRERVRVLGLMVMPPLFELAELSRPYFRKAREFLATVRGSLGAEALKRHPLNELSMGTSQDFEVAIEEGSNWVRIGTGVFGDRKELQ